MPEPDCTLAYWLMPTEPARDYFASLIARLAARYNAPGFEPHLTVYATKNADEDAGDVLRRAIGNTNPFRLLIRGISYSDKFTKTLFVEFEQSDQLAQLSQNLRRASALQNEYELNPHVSLIYKTMPAETKAEIASSLSLPFHEVRFDSAKAVISPAQIESRADVEAWRVVATQRLKE